jgi:hypothetical protein
MERRAVTTSASTERERHLLGIKTASIRLLDLLAGWSAYLSADEENGLRDPALGAEEVGTLYQLAGDLSESWESLSGEEQHEAVSAFVEERILPLLVGRSRTA